MNTNPNNSGRNWATSLSQKRARPVEWLIEKGIFLVSLSTIIMVFLIFLFVGKEAYPIIIGQMNSTVAFEPIQPDQMSTIPKEQLLEYLDLSATELTGMDEETLMLMMEIKLEEAAESPEDKDAGLNTTKWEHLIKPHQWTGYSKPEYIWQPVSDVHKYNIVPLLLGSLKVTLVALLVALPLSLAAAIYVSQLASPRLKEWLKPAIELLGGIPSVVLGFFALLVMTTALEQIFDFETRLNSFVAGIALGLAIVPVVFSIAEDALTSVPRSYTQAALALGATKWQASWKIVLPAALPGVFAAFVLGFGRAIGETMIVLMASGNASILSANLFDSARTITATIAAELAETVFGGHHYRMLFMLGAILFAITFISNLAGDIFIHRLKKKLEGRA
ncbi:phosphate ABC transporter permease subunit PstC [Verrucomicrobia bacterium]|nr:phosphate ABC transporter permease subunit PstC [Verrucomicrobiota bacterium]